MELWEIKYNTLCVPSLLLINNDITLTYIIIFISWLGQRFSKFHNHKYIPQAMLIFIVIVDNV